MAAEPMIVWQQIGSKPDGTDRHDAALSALPVGFLVGAGRV